MGPEERQPDADLRPAAPRGAASADPVALETLRRFADTAPRFSYYRLIYLLERLFPAAPPVGQLGPAQDERIRLRGDPSLIFASSDVSELAPVKSADGVERARVSTTFLSLYGSVSPMPAYFIEQIAQADYQGGPQPIRELLDVFHHRLLSLLYRAWTKYRLPVTYRKQGADPFSRRMLCAVGVDGFRGYETPLDRFFFLRYASVLASKSRSARNLETVLSEMLGNIGVKIEQFVGHWTKIEKPFRNKLGVMNHQLGESLTLGRYVFDGSGRYKVVLGPVGYDEYLSFLPGGRRQDLVRGVIETFTPGIHDVMLEIHVDTEEAPRFQLGSPRAATLKRTAWIGGSAAERLVITIPLDDKHLAGGDDEDDDDRGEPPPM
ncbi:MULTISPECIES: type VI secretion system baseplate subunit TssG [Sorangium]|uniref:Type VI secretion system baseplate subunit TssG n=1 Tax=Sorangium atrum TaxID=2995308 RepID=A0ABT5BSI4_9BACT|nr:type VI secretion system baseplate subunit TssG [Sorangium aterium]MDC0677132.1 type VI secretion system baseplate subunit TssG [Sorangium aterium]